ncbi:hypothetical protein O3P69_002302 [Scylla paramamosain]|uniref:Uncharacterized protein n=1 Tax=Scylla paramamosain TaxID=85552 RepID=A0AAW0V8A1_SCYPA
MQISSESGERLAPPSLVPPPTFSSSRPFLLFLLPASTLQGDAIVLKRGVGAGGGWATLTGGARSEAESGLGRSSARRTELGRQSVGGRRAGHTGRRGKHLSYCIAKEEQDNITNTTAS